jgi:hypothetical protein
VTASAIVSILANGRFREVGRLEKGKNPAHLEIDTAFIFADEGARAAAFSDAYASASAGRKP